MCSGFAIAFVHASAFAHSTATVKGVFYVPLPQWPAFGEVKKMRILFRGFLDMMMAWYFQKRFLGIDSHMRFLKNTRLVFLEKPGISEKNQVFSLVGIGSKTRFSFSSFRQEHSEQERYVRNAASPPPNQTHTWNRLKSSHSNPKQELAG